MKRFLIVGGILVALVVGAIIFKASGPSFDYDAERVAADLNGQYVNLNYNQVWPFDGSQEIKLTIVGEKYVDDFLIVAAEINAKADVYTPEDEKNKDKLPSKVKLTGFIKITYEEINGEWYFVGVDNIGLKAVPAQ